jgi:prepilin-type N-terminal cleavage/methylation domain-containing protein
MTIQRPAACSGCASRGFTIIEIMFVVAIIGILAAIAGTLYTHYYDPRARASEVITQYDALRTRLQEDFQANGMRQECRELVELARGNLQSPYVKLDLGTLPVDQNDPTKGHRAVITVTGTLQDHGARGVQIARAVHDELAKNGVVVGKPVLTDSIVLFSLRLSDGPMCQLAMSSGGASSLSPQPQLQPQAQPQPQPEAVATPSIPSCPPGKDPVQVPGPDGRPVSICLDKCPPGQTRDPVNYTTCTAPTTQPPAQLQQQTGTTGSSGAAGGAAAGTSTGSAAAGSGGVSHQQCVQQCRAQYPHGNSRAYRDCMAGCS